MLYNGTLDTGTFVPGIRIFVISGDASCPWSILHDLKFFKKYIWV